MPTFPINWTRSRRILLWSTVLLPFASLFLVHWSDKPGYEAGDYTQYLAHATAIAEGRPYTDIGFIYTQHRAQLAAEAEPPALPFLLAPVIAFLDSNMMLVKLFFFGAALAFLLLAGSYFAAHDDRWLGLGVALLSGLSLQFLYAATQISADLPFAALVWTVIALMDAPGKARPGRIAAIASAGALAILFRTAGVALVPAALLYAAFRPRERAARALIPAAVWTAVFFAMSSAIPVTGAVMSEMARPFAGIIDDMATNVRAYRFATMEALLYPFPWNTANDVYHLLAVAAMGLGLALWIRTGWARFLSAFTIAYVGMLLSLPTMGGRFLRPLFPLFIFGLLNGLRAVIRRLRPRLSATTAGRVALWTGATLGAFSVGWELTEPRPQDILDHPDVVGVYAALERFRTDAPMRVELLKPRIFTLHTRIPAMGLFEAEPTEVVTELCAKRITHVVAGDLGIEPKENAALSAAVDEYPALFLPVYENRSFAVYRFVPTTIEHGSGAGPGPVCTSAPAAPG